MRFIVISLILALVISTSFSVTMHIVGVSEINGKYYGVLANLTVIKKPGHGNVFISTNPLTKVDTQASARLARDIACETLNVDCSNYDFYYLINSESPLVGGPSAGAAMTVATMCEIENITPYSDVLITGTITPYGDIGPVGGIYEKMIAASKVAKIFLIPEGEGQIVKNLNNSNVTIDLNEYAEKNYGMKVIEVNNIYDAFKYMTGNEIKLNKKIFYYNQDGMKKIANALINSIQRKNFDLKDLTPDQAKKIEDAMKKGEELYEKAMNSFDNGKYYSAASFAVGSMVNYNYASDLYNLYKNPNFFDDKVNYIRMRLSVIKSMIKNAKIDSPEDIEVIAISYDRLMDAYKSLDKANEEYYKGNKEQAMYDLAYSDMRRLSSYDWLFLLDTFKGNLSYHFNQSSLRDLAMRKIDEASNYVTYADVLVSTQANIEAHEHLKNSEEAFSEGNYLYSIFEASRAYADASIAIEAPYISIDINKTLDKFRDGTVETISNIESQGIVPIMALNYLQYADSLRNSDPADAFIYYAYARNFAILSKDILNAEKLKVISSPVIIEKHYKTRYLVNYKSEILQEMVILISGILSGIAVTLWKIEKR